MNMYDKLKEEIDDDEALGVAMFMGIYELYLHDSEKYSFKTNALNFRLSQTDFDRFMNVPGTKKSDKLRFLLDKYYQKE